MFKESQEGQTHSYNDGCGCPDHNREEGVFYPESFPHDCCDKCIDVTYEKTWPSHTAYFACINLKCECHKSKS